MNPRKQPARDASSEIDLLGAYYAFRGQAWLIALFALLGLLAGALYVCRAPVVYEGQAVIQVDQTERKVVKIDEIGAETFESMEALKTLEQNLSNWKLLERVAQNPKLNLTPAALGLRSSGGGRRARAILFISCQKEFMSA